jgi:hypothetical protein
MAMAAITGRARDQAGARCDFQRHKWPALPSVTLAHIALGSGAREPAILSSRPSWAVVLWFSRSSVICQIKWLNSLKDSGHMGRGRPRLVLS